MRKLPLAAGALAALATTSAGAQNEPFIGQLFWTAANFCPRGWAEANGQLLSISQNTALFSILGTTYGGNGQTTFGLPDLRGRSEVNSGQGPGLSPYTLGQHSGTETTTLLSTNLPAHSHTASTTVTARANSTPAESASPMGNVLADARTNRIYSTADASVNMGATSISATTSLDPAGGGQPVNNIQPSLALKACVALVGVFPSRN